MSKEKQIDSVVQRIKDAIDQDFNECGKYRRLRIFISKDLLYDLKKECGFPKTDYRFTIAAMICGYELEIVEGENRLFLARKI